MLIQCPQAGQASIAMAIIVAISPPAAYAAAKLTTLYSFSGQQDGGEPLAGLVYQNGALYGTTQIGGTTGTPLCNTGCGAIFKVDVGTGRVSVAYRFQGAPDGSEPGASVTAHDGLLYGTTASGGVVGCGYRGRQTCGTVFQIDAASGAERVIYRFSSDGGDGQFPLAGLIYQGGLLFGTTSAGGTDGYGTVFALNPQTGTEKVLYSFSGGADGAFPTAGVIYQQGKLYGTTAGFDGNGSIYNGGTVFSVDARSGAERTLYHFTGPGGSNPVAGLLFERGALYSTTTTGGKLSSNGVVFKVEAASGAETVLYNFGNGHPDDGWDSLAGLIAAGGTFYGTTFAGGIAGCFTGSSCGTIFSINPKTGRETVLYDFTGGRDGGQPMAGLVYVNGAFYGTTAGENASACENHLGCGTVFKFIP